MANRLETREQGRKRGREPPPIAASLHSNVRMAVREGRHTSSILPAPPVPRHPVPSMQGAFEESIYDLEATRNSIPEYSRPPSLRGRRQRSQHHWLMKVVSQIAFGIHLLHARVAKSDSEVVRILQSHVNDMDVFISKTTTDFDLAKSDISQRLKHLRVPLDSEAASMAFDGMLQSREFRLQILQGNANVEYVVSQTMAAMKWALRDVAEGLAAVDDLAKYLLALKDGWRNANLLRVYAAMTFNVEQWFRGLAALQSKSVGLKEKLEQLRAVVAEVERRTGVASRKSMEVLAAPATNKKRRMPPFSLNKSLPPTPPPDSLLNSVDIRSSNSQRIPKHSRPEVLRPMRSFSQRLIRKRNSVVSTATESSLGDVDTEIDEDTRKKNRVRIRPTPEIWPEPLYQRTRRLSKAVDHDRNDDGGENTFAFRLDGIEKTTKTKEKEKARASFLGKPDSCVIM